jgi:Kef-type K+ transport system membrane component KefB
MHFSTHAVVYIGVTFGVLVIPRALQRFRIPAPLTCIVFGIGVAIFAKPVADDRVFRVLAALGIASLFLLAGLEVNLLEIRRQRHGLALVLVTRVLILAAAGWCAFRYLGWPWQADALFALGLFTPSTGFILDMLPASGLDASEQSAVAINAIVGEISALLILFAVLQASSVANLAISSAALFLLIVLTPVLFLALGKYVVPYAPGSEFSLLLMVGIICAVISDGLGVHFLVGAFVAGLIARLLQEKMTTLTSDENLHAVRLFASFFVPFYFFHEGLKVPPGALVLKAVLWGIALSTVVLTIRIAKDWVESRYSFGRNSRSSIRVAVALSPTLIFTLVIAGILHETYRIDDALYGGLLVYAAISTVLPSVVLPRFTLNSTAAGSTSPAAPAPSP